MTRGVGRLALLGLLVAVTAAAQQKDQTTTVAKGGEIKGVLLNKKTRAPESGVQVQAPAATLKADGSLSLTFDPQTRKAQSDSTGRFHLKGLAPGRYGLAVYGARITTEDGKGSVTIVIKGPKDVVDLGKILLES